jgi:hypothetical protein
MREMGGCGTTAVCGGSGRGIGWRGGCGAVKCRFRNLRLSQAGDCDSLCKLKQTVSCFPQPFFPIVHDDPAVPESARHANQHHYTSIRAAIFTMQGSEKCVCQMLKSSCHQSISMSTKTGSILAFAPFSNSSIMFGRDVTHFCPPGIYFVVRFLTISVRMTLHKKELRAGRME